ncbi:18926_t:CDS:1, partial [Gigaspora rosea]
LSDHEPYKSNKYNYQKQTSIVNFLSYENVTESKVSSSEKSDNNIIPEQY